MLLPSMQLQDAQGPHTTIAAPTPTRAGVMLSRPTSLRPPPTSSQPGPAYLPPRPAKRAATAGAAQPAGSTGFMPPSTGVSAPFAHPASRTDANGDGVNDVTGQPMSGARPTTTGTAPRPFGLPLVRPLAPFLPGGTSPTSTPPAATGSSATSPQGQGSAAGAPAAPPPPPPPAAQGAQTQTITGNEAPYQVLPTQSQGLQGLLGQLQSEVGRQLQAPTVYDDALFKQVSDAQKAGINENFDAADRSLAASLAARGLDYSSIAGGKLNDINTARARALSDIDTTNARDRAMALAAGRSSAFGNASGLAGFLGNLEAGNRDELRTERGYNDALRTQAYNQSLQEALLQDQLNQSHDSAFQQLLAQALGYGQAPGAASMLFGAGGLLGSTASGYSQREGQADAGVGSLAELLGRMFGGGQSQ